MPTRYANIVGWGMYTPQRVIPNAELAQQVNTSDEWIVARTGIRKRRIVGSAENNSQMATDAGRAALQKAGVHPRELDLIIVATSSGDHITPPVSSLVQHALGARDVPAFVLTTGCTGFIYALATAHQFIAAGTYENVLVIGVEIISRWLDWSDRATCVLFGDGAGAVLLQATEEECGVLSFELGSDGGNAGHLIVPAGGSAMPTTHETLNNGLNNLYMNGREVFKFATRVLGRALRRTIAKAGLTKEDIDLFIPHQANKRIIESAARQAKLPMEKVFVNIHEYGNTSAASIPIALCEALEERRAGPGDVLAFVAFGAGLTWAAAVVKLGTQVARVSAPGWLLRLSAWMQSPAHKVVAPLLALAATFLLPVSAWLKRRRA